MKSGDPPASGIGGKKEGEPRTLPKGEGIEEGVIPGVFGTAKK